jgi:hypothetical protein
VNVQNAMEVMIFNLEHALFLEAIVPVTIQMKIIPTIPTITTTRIRSQTKIAKHLTRMELVQNATSGTMLTVQVEFV